MTSRSWLALTAAFAFAMTLLVSRPAQAINCIDDRDCGGATPACNFGICAECSQGNATACRQAGTRTPSCLHPYGICGCDSDNQCGPGLICSRPGPAAESPGYCVSGCRAADGQQGTCPTNYQCNGGQCTKSCLPFSDCPSPPRNVCTFPLTGSCVECNNNDGQCGGKPGVAFCDTSYCVQCRDGNDCAGHRHGPRCHGAAGAPRSCGCNNDTECGLGKICEDTIRACITGCRLPDGSKCPAGSICRVAAGGGEACVGIPDAGPPDDGGVIDDGGTIDGGRDGGSRDAGRGGGDGGDGFSLEGGGWSCSISSSEDAIPALGLLTVGGLGLVFARRSRGVIGARKSRKGR